MKRPPAPEQQELDLFTTEGTDAPLTRIGAAAPKGKGRAGEGKVSRLKEKGMRPAHAETRQPAAPAISFPDRVEQREAVRPWPAALNWDNALEYTSFSARSLRRAELEGQLTFRRVGPNGSRVVTRQQLDQLLARTFGAPRPPIDEDFDFA